MYIGKINKCDTGNGKGVRVSVFISGCPHHCKGCFNPETWDYAYGIEYTDKVYQEIKEALNKPYIQGLSILGGEPLAPSNREEVLSLIKKVRQVFGKTKDIFLWTGYTYEELQAIDDNTIDEILNNIQILVDGRYVEELRDLTLPMAGSSNQRVIHT